MKCYCLCLGSPWYTKYITLMQYTHRITTLIVALKKLPKRYYFITLFLALSLSYAMIFVLKQPVVFSYANESCVGRLTILPNLHTSSSDDDFTVTLRGGLAGVYATEACVKPVDAPEPGSRYAMTAPFGGWMFRQQYAVEVPKHPVANVTALKSHYRLHEP